MQHSDALRAPDLRVVDMGGVFGTWCIWPEDQEQGNCGIDGPVEDAIAFVYLLDDGSWEFKAAFLIDATRNMSCSFAYCHRRRDVTSVPERRRTEDDSEWKWRIFYLGFHTEECIFDGLVEYLDWISGWYDREVHGGLTVAAKQVKKPAYVQGVTDSNNFSDWDEIQNENESSEGEDSA